MSGAVFRFVEVMISQLLSCVKQLSVTVSEMSVCVMSIEFVLVLSKAKVCQ